MNPFYLNTNRKKLLLTIVLSLGITFLSAPIMGKNEPLAPDLISLTIKAQNLVASAKLNLPQLPSIIPQTERNTPTPFSSRNNPLTPYPTRPFGFTPSTGQPTPLVYTTTTPVGVTQVLPEPTDFDYPTDIPEPTDAPLPPGTTKAPRPTKVPRPTRAPTPTPIKLTNPRPGKNFADAANIVGEAMCVPAAMIRATLDIEYGPWMGDVEANWTARNTYHGSDPHDKPGSAVVPFGVVMQMMEDTWTRIKPILAQKFGTNEMSLEVTFDSMLAGAYHLRNISLAMQDKVSCDDWPVKYILYGACRYNGACAAGSHTYNQYSYTVCNNYNKYTTGPKKNCN